MVDGAVKIETAPELMSETGFISRGT